MNYLLIFVILLCVHIIIHYVLLFTNIILKRQLALYCYLFMSMYIITLIKSDINLVYSLGFLILLIVCLQKLRGWYSISDDSNEPPILTGFFPLNTAISYGINPRKYLEHCAQYLNSKIFTIYMAGDAVTVVLDSSFAKNFYKAGDSEMDFFKPLKKVGLYDLCGVSGEDGRAKFKFTMSLLRRNFVPLYEEKIPTFINDINETFSKWMSSDIGEINLWEFVDTLILRLSMRTICHPLAWNEKVIDNMGNLELQAEKLLKRPGVFGASTRKTVRELRESLLVDIKDEIKKRKDCRNDKAIDAIDICLNYSMKQNDNKSSQIEVTDKFIGDICVSLMFGAVANTNSTLYNVIENLIEHPKFLKEAEKEVENVFGKDGLTNSTVTFETLKSLPFIEACIYETTRIYSIVLSMRTTCKPIIINKEYFIPEDRIVAFSSNFAMADPNIYPNPFEFNPYRYFEDKVGKTSSKAAKKNHFGWGSGKHLCVGKKLALIEIKLILSMLLSKVKLQGLAVPVTNKVRGTSFVSLGVATPLNREIKLKYKLKQNKNIVV